MKKLFVRFKIDYAGHKSGDLVELDEAIARAYVDAAKAELAPQGTEDALVASLRSEIGEQVTAGLADIRRDLTAQISAVAAAGRPNPQAPTPGESEDDKFIQRGGFQSLGHFAGSLVWGTHRSTPDPVCRAAIDKYCEVSLRIQRSTAAGAAFSRATASGMSEQVDPDGGVAIPPTWNNQIWERTRALNNLVDKLDMIPIDGNEYRQPADAETSRVDGQRRAGIQGFWDGEAGQYTKSKPGLSDRFLRLKKLTVLVYATNEVLDDFGALEGYINRVAPEEITFKCNDAVMNGKGSGIPQGLLNSPCKVQVAKESGQATNTIVSQNVIKMFARLYAPSRGNAIWLCNQDAEPQLQQMSIAVGTAGGQLIYMPPNGLSQTPYATLYGRQVVPIEQCQTVGTEGDLVLVDLKQIQAIRKRVGIQSNMSIHLRFDFDETVFKFSFRMDCASAWSSSLTPFKGSNTQSPIISLQSRP